MRALSLVIGLSLCCLLGPLAWADEFKLTNGQTLTGEVLPTSANDQGVEVKIAEGQYQRVPWSNFSQDDLKTFAKNQRMDPFVEPFIEVNPAEKIQKTEVNLKPPPRLERPPKQALFSALLSSSVGVFVLLVLYATNIYAAFEIAIFRAKPPMLVCGLAAVPVLGFLAPIVFLSLPTRITKTAPAMEVPEPASGETAANDATAVAAGEDEVNPMHADGAAHPSGLKLAHSDTETTHKPKLPETITYQRGQFTFNRRFFETKFPGFFSVVRRDAEKDLLLVIKSSRGEYAGDRISRIAANDIHLQVPRGHATEEVLIPFQEIQEIRLKHKDA
ncbi:MAG TPA: hypothetical protein VG146_19365 [Verrucomicrobiae bacterium]|nr:hypothetical protein [Verrucomicrobiae bacterium]